VAPHRATRRRRRAVPGDYIYEAETIQTLGVVRYEPTIEAQTLQGYRQRYQHYKSDPDLQAAHEAHPFVPIWDDHEVYNDYTKTAFTLAPARIAGAYQAWFEYMPVWPVDGTRIYRDFRWGDLAHICMLDTRQYRDAKLTASPLFGPTMLGPGEAAAGRSILGTTQRAWLLGALDQAQADGVPWKIIGNQVLMGALRTTDLDHPNSPPGTIKHAGWYSSSLDTWDGFPWERDLVLGHLDANGIENTMILTGDYHSFWQMTLTTDFDDPAAPKVANDFATGSISSAGGAINELFMSGGTGQLGFFPPYNFADMVSNGYGIIEASPTESEITFYKMQAIYSGAVPIPSVKFTMTPGDPDPVQQLL
jgi:alkaline phosphatase D